jgi:serine protease inhibitor
MMRQKYDMKYTTNKKLKFAAVSVPYQNNAVSMVIVRPDDLYGLSEIESSIIQGN